MTFVAHWDDVQWLPVRAGALRAQRQDLGRAAGSAGASVKRVRVEPGARPTPAHSHGRDEEFFFVLDGDGLSWQDGRTHAVGPGDCLFHHAAGPAHTLVAGDRGLELLVFGTEAGTSATRLPRAGVFWMGPWWVADPAGARPFEREPEDLPGEPGERPPTTVHVDAVRRDVTERPRAAFEARELGEAVGSVATGMAHVTIRPGREGFPPHMHSAEEELFVVLGGDGTVILGEDEHPVRRGSVVARPPGTRVAHSWRAGPQGLTYLAWGTREPNDICLYPRSGKVNIRGVGLIGRIEPLPYWEGED